MYQAVQMTGRFFDLFSHVFVTVEVKHIRDQVQSVLIVLYFGVEIGQVEAIGQIFFIDVAEVLIASRGYELEIHTRVSQCNRETTYYNRTFSAKRTPANLPLLRSHRLR